jgi:hypothetical protein
MTPSQRHPWLRPLAVAAHRIRRRLQWLRPGTDWAGQRRAEDLRVRVKRHRSLLLRELAGAAMELQHNKVVNLRLASARVDGLLIRPGETFSFTKVVGNCTRRKGYVEGMRLSDGTATSGVGGGICQLANLLHWMFLHSPLTVVERSEHSFDPFPDNGRVLPWGVGCSIVYNYVDLVVRTTPRRRSSCGSGSASGTCAASSAPTGGCRSPTGSRRATSASSSARTGWCGAATRSGARPSTAAPATPSVRSWSSATGRS